MNDWVSFGLSQQECCRQILCKPGTCPRGTTCKANTLACRAECVLISPCTTNPCEHTKCSAGFHCVVNQQTCNSDCIADWDPVDLVCFPDPCEGVLCGASAICNYKSQTCEAECVHCDNARDPCSNCLDKTKCTVEGCVGTCNDDIIFQKAR